MDFWASWCIPCVEEMAFSKKLIDHFSDKDVAFLFLSTDVYSVKWLSALKSNELSGKGLSYLILDIENNAFLKKYNIGPIPRYILINKKGEIVDADAPRPSEKNTKEIIEQLLKKD